MYFKGVLLIWSWQRKIPCCSVHLHTLLVHCFTYKILTFQKERLEKLFVFSCLPLSCTPHPPFFFFSIPLKLCLCWAWRQILPSLCTLLRITFKSGAGFGRSPSALGFCAAVRITSCDLWFADDMSMELLVAVEALLQINPGNMWYDATGKQPSCYQHWQIAVFLTRNRTSVFSLVQRTDRHMALNSAILQVQNI